VRFQPRPTVVPPTGIEPVHAVEKGARPRRLLYGYVRCVRSVRVRAEPNRLWVCDLKYVQTGQGFLFLAAVQDVFSRRIIGWSMRDDLKAELVLDALGTHAGASSVASIALLARLPSSTRAAAR
jgi:transposase InsO family protein